MAKTIKMKKILKENYSGTVAGGVVNAQPFHNNISLSKIVKEKFGEVSEEKIDIEGLKNGCSI